MVSVFGVRHHGPGSARSLVNALGDLSPDIILIEGPPDANAILKFAAHSDMKPPVALLVYDPADLRRVAFYPFAEFSPEWQAIQFGFSRSLPVRFIDLPISHRFALAGDESASEDPEAMPRPFVLDPIQALAEAAGFDDGERWWECMVEHRWDARNIFEAITEGVGALRSDAAFREDARGAEALREPHMRHSIRVARKEGFQAIAVVCGAFHAPALLRWAETKKHDEELLKGLPKTKTHAAWIPWTHGRLASQSGYGAGVDSPGWCLHLWETGNLEGLRDFQREVAVRWMTKAAQLMRVADLDAPSAHVIEAVRLAEALASLRGRLLPGLSEMNESIQAVFCAGDDAPMKFIREKLIVGEMFGITPADAPVIPLQKDIQAEQKRFRLPSEAVSKVVDLDLRKPLDLGRSHLLHRLSLLGIQWGIRQEIGGKLGTFHEYWQIQWKPEFFVRIIEMSLWGNTAAAAAAAFACHIAADESLSLVQLTEFLDDALLAGLPDAAECVMTHVEAKAAVIGDISHFMDALPKLAKIARYGNVRRTDARAVRKILDGIVVRVCIGLPLFCISLDDDAAAETYRRIQDARQSIHLLQNAERLLLWRSALTQVINLEGVHGLIVGQCMRILFDDRTVTPEEVERRMSHALSAASSPTFAAAWIEGFFKGSGLALLHDEALWRTFDGWMTALSTEIFHEVLPLLRRTFATFSASERRRMGERVKKSSLGVPASDDPKSRPSFDMNRADAVLPVIAAALGLSERIAKHDQD